MADAKKHELTTLQTVLLVAGSIAAGATIVFVAAKVVQLSRVNQLRRLGAGHVHGMGLSGAMALGELPSGNLALYFRGLDNDKQLLELGPGERAA